MGRGIAVTRKLAGLRPPVLFQCCFQCLERSAVRTLNLVRHARSGVPSSAGPVPVLLPPIVAGVSGFRTESNTPNSARPIYN
jgi:hypothetical protein